MANKITLESDLLTMLTTTIGASGTEKMNLRNGFVLMYPVEYQKFLTDQSLPDTGASRSKFACYKTVDFWADIYRAGRQKVIDSERPSPETL